MTIPIHFEYLFHKYARGRFRHCLITVLETPSPIDISSANHTKYCESVSVYYCATIRPKFVNALMHTCVFAFGQDSPRLQFCKDFIAIFFSHFLRCVRHWLTHVINSISQPWTVDDKSSLQNLGSHLNHCHAVGIEIQSLHPSNLHLLATYQKLIAMQ